MPHPTLIAAGGFTQFGRDHFAALAVVAAVTTLLIAGLRRAALWPAGTRIRVGVCRSLGALLLLAFVVEQVYEIARGFWEFEKSLPLHLCDFAVFVTTAALLAEGVPRPPRRERGDRVPLRQYLFELAYFWGLAGTVQALLTPELAFGFPHPLYWTFFGLHGGIVAAVLVMTLGLRMRPARGMVRRVWLATNGLAICVGLFDWAAGANYMYLLGPPEKPSLYDYFGRWPWSLVTLEVVGTVVLVLVYVPFRVAARNGRAGEGVQVAKPGP